MKLIIDVPEDYYKTICEWDIAELGTADTSIVNGTPIPDNATNGEVLKIMFMPNRITRTNDIVHVEYDFTPEWWNSPYKKGGK